MSLQWTTFSLLLAVAAATTPRVAAAQPVAPPSSTATPESAQLAKAHFDEGVKLLLAYKFAEAEAELEAAWALSWTTDVAFNLGNAEYGQGKYRQGKYWQGKYRDAAEHYSFALRKWPEANTAQRTKAQERLAESRMYVGALTVTVNAADAEVLVDGVSVGKAPLPGEVFVEPGPHTVEAKLGGYVIAKEPITIEKGGKMTVDLRRTAAPLKVADDLRGEGGPSKGLIIAGITSSGVAVTGGAVLAIVSNLIAADADAQTVALRQRGGVNPCVNAAWRAECADIDRKNKLSDALGDWSLWSFVAGGVLGAGTVIFTLAAPKSETPTKARVLPVVAHGGGGLVLVGEW